MAKRLLILGGTAEAAELARLAACRFADQVTVISSFAGRLPPRADLPGEIRTGGFGGADGLASYLVKNAIDLVVDATHPFAAVISANAEAACRAVGTPRLMLIRPPWQPEPGDRWREVADTTEAAATVAAIARRAFLTTGPGELDAFAGIAHVWFLVRLFTPPAAPPVLINHETIVARPPFTIAGERALLRAHGIDTLVTKQSGGPTEAKLGAARDVGCQVVVIRRPPPPPGESVATVAEALEWVGHRAGGR